jgi:HK97 family phage portal protein
MLLRNGQALGLAPQALAELVPLTTTGYFYAKDGLTLERQYATYGQLYKSQPWVAVVVDKLANAVARLPLNVYDESGDERTLDTTSAFAKLLAQPNSEMDTYGFWRWLVSTYEIYGEAYLLKLRDDAGRVIQLLPMHPMRTQIRRSHDGTEWPGAKPGDLLYVFTTGVASAGLVTAVADDVIPFKRYNPDGLMRGFSRLEPLRSTLMNEDSARRAMAAFWRNMGRPSMVLESEKALSKNGRDRLSDSFALSHGGSGNVGKALVLEDGVTAKSMQLTAEEMSYIESRKLNREEACAVYDVPPPVVHILDNATFSNITEQMRSMYRDTMAPRIVELESILDAHLRPEFGRTSSSKCAKFAVDEVLRGDIETRATTAVQLVTNGIAKPDELRPWFSFDQVGGVADKLYANSAMAPLGQKPPAPVAPAPKLDPEQAPSADDKPGLDPTKPDVAPEDDLPDKGNKHYRAIMGRIGRGQDLARIKSELIADLDPSDIDEARAVLKALSDAEAKVSQNEQDRH